MKLTPNFSLSLGVKTLNRLMSKNKIFLEEKFKSQMKV